MKLMAIVIVMALLRMGTLFGVACAEEPPAPARALTVTEAVRQAADPAAASGDLVGAAVAVYYRGETTTVGVGVTQAGKPGAPDGRTLFEIGSITKVFTALMLARSHLEGGLGVDAPLSQSLPEGTKAPTYQGKEITLGQLASHVSGLPRLSGTLLIRAALTGNPYEKYTRKEIYADIGSMKLSQKPGETYAYSNFGVGLLGQILADRAHCGYEALVVDNVCNPLGLNDTRITLSPDQTKRLAAPHQAKGRPAARWTMDAIAGAGALLSTSDDMMKFGRFVLDAVNAKDADKDVPTDARGKLARAVRLAVQTRVREASQGVEVGLGWHRFLANPEKGVPLMIWHNGGTGGYRSFLGIAPERDFVIVVLTNANSAPADAVALAVTRSLLFPNISPKKP